jgi:two-component system response regulator
LIRRRILLVEDNPDDESLTQRALRRGDWGAEVIVARDGAAALETLENMAELPDLVLLDLKLPKLDGTEVLRQIRGNDRTRCLCVVVFTSSGEPRDIVLCQHLGCNSYVIKPVAYESYISTVQQIGVYWLTLNETSLHRS